MRLDRQARRTRQREAKIRREIERLEPQPNSCPTYQPSAGSLVDCKGGCGRVVFPFIRDGHCVDCAAQAIAKEQ